MPPRIKDVARRAGVSSATVSRVLSNHPHVSPETREKVLRAIEELGYRPSRVARSLRAQRSRIIGLIISDIQNPFFTALVRAVEDVAYEHDYAIFLGNSDEDIEKEGLYVEVMRAEHVAGVVISPTQEDYSPAQHLVALGIPVVTIDRAVRGLAVDSVLVDNVGAAYTLVDHIIKDGHTRVAAVVGIPEATTGRERFEGYRRALEDNGLPLDERLVRRGLPKEHVGYEMTRELLHLPQPPTALFTGNNLLTLGALRAIREAGLHIPDDIALVAFDELDWMPLFEPALTVAAQPTYELGRQATELLLKRIGGWDEAPRKVVLTPTIHIRRSCAPHPEEQVLTPVAPRPAVS